jgi:DUF1365 family protein
MVLTSRVEHAECLAVLLSGLEAGGRVAVMTGSTKGREAILFARMQGQLQPISDRRLLGYFLRMPLTPLKVLAAIHWQALRLMSKRIRFYRKQEFADKQKDYYERKDHSRHVT